MHIIVPLFPRLIFITIIFILLGLTFWYIRLYINGRRRLVKPHKFDIGKRKNGNSK